MSRIPRIHVKGALYYVTSRGDHEQIIFKEAADYNAYKELLKRYKTQHEFKLFAFIFLPTHLHLLLELTKDVTISQIMHGLSSNYTKYFNGKYERKGHLFQERYKMVVAEKSAYLLPIITYLHLHPCRIGLAKEPAEYKFSSYLNYKGEKIRAMDIDMDKEIKEAVSYGSVTNEMSKEETDALGKALSKDGLIGSEEFVRDIKARAEYERAKLVEKPQAPSYMPQDKRFVIAGGLVILCLAGFVIYSYARMLATKERFNAELTKEKMKVQSLDERYRADKVSYEAIAKRLEIEKKRTSELEKKIE